MLPLQSHLIELKKILVIKTPVFEILKPKIKQSTTSVCVKTLLVRFSVKQKCSASVDALPSSQLPMQVNLSIRKPAKKEGH